MITRQAYKFELLPNGEQQRKMRQFAGACRFVYNQALAWQQAAYALDNTQKFSYTKIANLLPLWKSDPSTTWLKDAPSQSLQQSLKNLERGFKNFFAKLTDFPRFKKKGTSDSVHYPQGFKVEQHNNRLILPKLGWMRYHNSRAILGIIKNITISQKNGKWFASIQTEQEAEQPIHPASSVVGVDLGIAQFATLSTGEVFLPVNSFKVKQIKLARYQRAMSRKIKFSKNWQKAKQKISKLHSTIANIRRDYLHKITTTISKNHALVVIEDLQISNMSKSASGTRVKAKSGLNKAILDQGWSEFRRQLEYKQAWCGGLVQTVPPQYTSQRCACCGFVAKENRSTQSKFACLACGHKQNADINAAQNILAAGLAVLACGEAVQLDPSAKQEPTKGKHSIPSEPVGIPVL